jgi:hypothetical protein
VTLAALASDPALPGLELASDPDEMREVFRRRLRPVATSKWEIRECRISRVHYHRGDRCMLRYTLGLVDPAGRRERNQWVTGLIQAGDRIDQTWHKLRERRLGREVTDAFTTFESLALVPEARMLVQVFPYDRRLPTLLHLTVPRLLDLETVLIGQFGRGVWEIEAWNVEPLQYRPGRIAVLRHTVQARDTTGATSETRRFYVKVYRDVEDGERAHGVAQMLSDRADVRGIAVPSPIAYLSHLHALVLGEVAGRSLRQAILRDGDASAVRTAARGLAAAQREPIPELPEHRLPGEIATLDRAGQILAWARPGLRDRIEEVVHGVAAGLEDVPASPTHRELKTDHIFLDGSRLGVVDLDSYAAADPVLDPARVLADLAGLSRRCIAGDGRWEKAAGDFAEQYLAGAPASWRDRLFVQYAGALVKEALDFFQHQRPEWPVHVDTLVEEARNSLSRRAFWAA